MRLLLATILMSLLSTRAHAVSMTLLLDGGYNYSRLEYRGAATFTLLSSGGTFGRAEISMGDGDWDFLLRGQMNQFTFEAPETRVITEPEIQTISYETGFRWKTPALWASLTYEGKETLYLKDTSPTDYALDKKNAGFAVFGVKLFGWGKGYRITLDGDFGTPVSGSTTPTEGNIEYGYFVRGFVRVEFGNSFRLGFIAGMENHEYSVGTSEYYRSDFIAGLTLAIGAGKSSGNKSLTSGAPRYPLF